MNNYFSLLILKFQPHRLIADEQIINDFGRQLIILSKESNRRQLKFLCHLPYAPSCFQFCGGAVAAWTNKFLEL